MDVLNAFVTFSILVSFCEIPFIFLDKLSDAVKFRIKLDKKPLKNK